MNLAVQVAQLRASIAEKDSLIAELTGMHTKVIDMVAYNSVRSDGENLLGPEEAEVHDVRDPHQAGTGRAYVSGVAHCPHRRAGLRRNIPS